MKENCKTVYASTQLRKDSAIAYSILIPVLDERENIKLILDELQEILVTRDQLNVDKFGEILVIDGGSNDGTREYLSHKISDFPFTLRLLRLGQTNGGFSTDLLLGAQHARGNVLLVMDGDCSHSCRKIPELIKPILNDKYDMVIGSRYVDKGTIKNWSFKRKVFSQVSTWLTLALVQVRDPLSGYFAVKKELFLKYGQTSSGFKIGLEIMVKGEKEIRIREVPITFYGRNKGKSKMNLEHIMAFISQLCRLSLNHLFKKIRGVKRNQIQ